MSNRPAPALHVLILAAGPVMNFVFAILAYWVMFMVGVPGTRPVIGEVDSGSLAARAGPAHQELAQEQAGADF